MGKKNKISKFRRSNFETILGHLNSALSEGLNLSDKAKSLGLHVEYFMDYRRRNLNRLLDSDIITLAEYDDFVNVYEKVKTNNNNNKLDKDRVPVIENRTTIHTKSKNKVKQYGEEVRDNNNKIQVGNEWVGKITHYEYCVADSHGNPHRGEINRADMEEIYRYYSSLGANLTRKGVALELCHRLDIDLPIFQRILSVFGITKASLPLAPHEIEEKTVSDNVKDSVMLREREISKKINEQRYATIEQQYKNLLIEVEKLREANKFNIEWLKELDFSNVVPYHVTYEEITNKKEALVVYLSDMHIGASVGDDSLYSNQYDKQEVYNRLSIILRKIVSLYRDKDERYDRLMIVNLGDSLDGYNAQTTRGGHSLPQNMNNKEQFNTFIEVMKWFFKELYDIVPANNIDYYAVGSSNHDGDFGYCANRTLCEYLTLKYPDMTAQVFEKLIGCVEYGKHTLCLTHGKDDRDMKKSFPLNLDDKTENFINNFLDTNDIYNSNIHFIKGDLHRCNVNYGKRFRYRNVGSIFGSSKWIHHNFGNTKAMCDMDIFDYNTNDVNEIRIFLN